MGTDKALLRLGGRTFLEIALENTRAVYPRPIIVGSRTAYSAYSEVIEDRFSDCGPMGGIHAALSATTAELNLVLSVDMPLMDPKFLRWLVARAAADYALATVPRAGGHLQSLCAVYRRGILPNIEFELERKQYKLERIVGDGIVQEGEIEDAGFSAEIFRNVNQPWEYEGLNRTMAEAAQPKEREQ